MSIIRVNGTQDVVLVFSAEWDYTRIFSELLENLLYKEIFAAIMEELECRKQSFIERYRTARMLDCDDKRFTTLDVSNNPELDYLENAKYVYRNLLSLAYEQEFNIAQSFKHAEEVVLYEYAKSKNCGMFSVQGKKEAAGNVKMQRKTVMKSQYVAEVEPVAYEGAKEPEKDMSLSYNACLSEKSRFLYGRTQKLMDCLVCDVRNPNQLEVAAKTRTSEKRERLMYRLEKNETRLKFHSICKKCSKEERKAEDRSTFRINAKMEQSHSQGNLAESKIESNDGGSSQKDRVHS